MNSANYLLRIALGLALFLALVAVSVATNAATLTAGIDVAGDNPAVVTVRGGISKYGYWSINSLGVCTGVMYNAPKRYFGLGMCAGKADPERIDTDKHYDIIVGFKITDRVAIEWNHKSNCRSIPLPCPWKGPKNKRNYGHDIIGVRISW